MADMSSRLLRIGKAYLDAARSRIAEIDQDAQAELERVFPDSDPEARGVPIASTADAFDRAASKIATARSLASQSSRTLDRAQNVSADPIITAYQVIGVPEGSDYAATEAAVNKLRKRCNPSSFPPGSVEQTQAADILDKVEKSLIVIRGSLHMTPENRFEKLEF